MYASRWRLGLERRPSGSPRSRLNDSYRRSWSGGARPATTQSSSDWKGVEKCAIMVTMSIGPRMSRTSRLRDKNWRSWSAGFWRGIGSSRDAKENRLPRSRREAITFQPTVVDDDPRGGPSAGRGPCEKTVKESDLVPIERREVQRTGVNSSDGPSSEATRPYGISHSVIAGYDSSRLDSRPLRHSPHRPAQVLVRASFVI